MTPETFCMSITFSLFVGNLIGIVSTFYFTVKPLRKKVTALQNIIRRLK